MSSSIEEQFDPPEWATREEVIKDARHYINYWKIEARQRNAQWLEAIKPRDSAWQPIETAPKDGKTFILIVEYGYVYIGLFDNDGYCQDMAGAGLDPTHWMPLPKPPTKEGKPSV